MDTNTSSLNEDSQKSAKPWPPLTLNTTSQDTECDAWKRMLEMVEQAAEDKRADFCPATELGWGTWKQIITLPPTIAKLKSVRKFWLYGSNLVRIPPEIGEMSDLEEFDIYTSYGSHWYPYEITRCPLLKNSRVSTRALYGNRNTTPPFPRLPTLSPEFTPMTCSVCNGPFPTSGLLQCWISLWVGSDILPLLVHACSLECISALPEPPKGCLPGPHQGGDVAKLQQDFDSRTTTHERLEWMLALQESGRANANPTETN